MSDLSFFHGPNAYTCSGAEPALPAAVHIATIVHWLRDAVESGLRVPLSPEEQKATLRRLSQVEGFEKYLHKAFFGQTRFSLGGDAVFTSELGSMANGATCRKAVHR